MNQRDQVLLESMRDQPCLARCAKCGETNPAVVEGDPARARWEPGDQVCPRCGAEEAIHSVATENWESPISKALREAFTVVPIEDNTHSQK